MSAESVHVHAPESHDPALQSLSTVHTNPVEGKEKKKLLVIQSTLIATWKQLLQSVSNLNCAQYYRPRSVQRFRKLWEIQQHTFLG